MATKPTNEVIYSVDGMHCASCEILIERKLLEKDGVKSVEASAGKNEVLIEYIGDKPSIKKLNELFRREKYVFSEKSENRKGSDETGKKSFLSILGIALLLIVGFLSLNGLGFSNLININSSASLPTFFTFGLLAGISSCAALIGGMVLSMSKQWLEIYSDKNSTAQKMEPHLMFNSGRLISYAFLGSVLGAIGSRLQISLQFTSLLIIAISVMMFFLGMQMIGVKAFRRFQCTMPKFITRYVADEKNFQGKYMPFIMGALTFFLPCGFTITAQGMALLSGNFLQGALIMFFFALGTTPALLLIGLSSVKFSSKPNLSRQFTKVAGILVLFFALFNINNQMNVLGFSSISDLLQKSNGQTQNPIDDKNLPPIVDGKQVIKMSASSRGYSPNYFKVKAGVPVKWEITDTGTSGCTNAIISQSLFSGQIDLKPGQVSVKEFTPSTPGKYKFSCWMGMISGIIEVVDGGNGGSSASAAAAANNDNAIPSGAKGCGCGGGNGNSCSISNNP